MLPSRISPSLASPFMLALLLPLIARSSAAQRPATPRLALQEEWRIDAKVEHLEQAAHIAIAPDGSMITAPQYGRGGIVAWDSTGKHVLWRMAIGRGDQYEIAFVNRIGWTGNQLWISDHGYDQIALVDARGKVTKSIELPPFARPSLGERHKYPVFASMDPLARYADGSLLVRPLLEKNVFDTPDFDSSSTHLLRISSGGVIGENVANYPPEQTVMFHGSRGDEPRPVPFQNRTLWNVSADGSRIAMVSATLTGKDSATIRVVMLGEHGDTIFARRYPFTPVRISAAVRDSAVAKANGNAVMSKLIPPIYPPANGIILGRDQTTLIALRPLVGDTANVPLFILDARGEPLGTAQIGKRMNVRAVDRDHVWALQRDGTNMAAVVRYKVVRPK